MSKILEKLEDAIRKNNINVDNNPHIKTLCDNLMSALCELKEEERANQNKIDLSKEANEYNEIQKLLWNPPTFIISIDAGIHVSYNIFLDCCVYSDVDEDKATEISLLKEEYKQWMPPIAKRINELKSNMKQIADKYAVDDHNLWVEMVLQAERINND